jgi:hypothetical protein
MGINIKININPDKIGIFPNKIQRRASICILFMGLRWSRLPKRPSIIGLLGLDINNSSWTCIWKATFGIGCGVETSAGG